MFWGARGFLAAAATNEWASDPHGGYNLCACALFHADYPHMDVLLRGCFYFASDFVIHLSLQTYVSHLYYESEKVYIPYKFLHDVDKTVMLQRLRTLLSHLSASRQS